VNAGRLREHAEAIFRAGLQAADAEAAVTRQLELRGSVLRVAGEPISLDSLHRVRLVGMGKASAAMARPLVASLGERIQAGVVVVKDGHGLPLARVEVLEAGHPVPDTRGARAAEKILRLLGRGRKRDLVFCLLSGGGSALTPAPAPGITLEEKQEVTRLLLSSGATIHETNTLRKHLSRLKGGQLARVANPSPLVSLILSDVVGDDLDTIASGPTVPDRGTFQDCLRILAARAILDRVPSPVLRRLESGVSGEIPETPKPGDPAFSAVRNVIVGNNRTALEAAAARARELGYRTVLPGRWQQGEARKIAADHVSLAREIRRSAGLEREPVCILTGGEATVTVRGPGKGGRNQEFVLAAALEIDGLEGIVVLSGGTDGTDGPTDAAGAVADGRTVTRARSVGMDPEESLRENDAYPFFQALGDLLRTGPTLTNVMDLRVLLTR
jgi:hydroxypyruvate reductase